MSSIIKNFNKFSAYSFEEVLVLIWVMENGIKKLNLTKRSDILRSMCIVTARSKAASSLNIVTAKTSFLGRISTRRSPKEKRVCRDSRDHVTVTVTVTRWTMNREGRSLFSKVSPGFSLWRSRRDGSHFRFSMVKQLRELFDSRYLTNNRL